MNSVHNTPEAAPGAPEPSFGRASEKLKDEGRRLVGEARSELEQLAQKRKSTAAGYLRDMGAAAAASSDKMRSTGHAGTASFMDITADEITRLGQEMDQRELGDLVRGIEDVARRQPALFLGASLITGFALMRFLKASAEDRTGSAATTQQTEG